MKISAALVALLVGCASSPPSNAPVPADVGIEPSAETLRTLARLDAADSDWNKHDVDGLMSHYAPGTMATYLGQAIPTPTKPIEAGRGEFETIWKIYPKARQDILIAMANGDHGAMLWRIDTGAGQTFAGAALTKHGDDGRMTEWRSIADGITHLHQWGVRPSERAPDREPMWEAPVRATATGSPSEAANVALVRKFNEAWFKPDTAALKAMFGVGYTHRALPSKEAQDGETLVKGIETEATVLDSSFDLRRIWAAGDWVVQESEITIAFKAGKHAGKTAKAEGILFSEVREGKVMRTIVSYNRAQAMVQLGEITTEEFKALEEAFMKKIMAAGEN